MASVWPPPPDHLPSDHPLPDNRLPNHPLPNHPHPNHPLLDNRLPDNRLPDNRLPDNRLHDNRLPDNRLPDNRLPDNRLPDNRLHDNRLPDNRLPIHQIPGHLLSDHPLPNHPHPNHPLLNNPIRDNQLPDNPIPNNSLPNHPLQNHPLPNHPLPNYPLPNHSLPNHPIQNHPLPDNSLLHHPIPDHRLSDNLPPNQPLDHQLPSHPRSHNPLLDHPEPNDPDYGPLDCSIPQPAINADSQPHAAHVDDVSPIDSNITPGGAPLDSGITQHDTINQLDAGHKDVDQSSQSHSSTLGSGGESFRGDIKEEVSPPMINCFVCDTSSTKTSTFLNVFQSDTAIREQLKERLEGVLAVELEEEQSAGPHVCNGCSQTLENIECLAAGLRAAFTTTQHAHCTRRNGYDQEINYTDESKTPLRHLAGNSQRIKLRVRHYDSSERARYRETTPQTDGEADDSEADYGAMSDVPVPKPRKRKNTKPQRVIREDNGISSDDEDPGDRYNADTDDQKDEDFNPDEDGYEPIVVIRKKRPHRQRVSRIIDSDDPGDDDFNPKESYEPVVKTKRTGRPKGSKTKKKKKPVHADKPPTTPREKQDQGGVCETCQKVFTSNYKLNRHRLSHSDQRPFKCPQCTHQFKAKYHLDRHLQIHSGVKPHLCPDCGTGFREKHQLAEHQLTHTGEQPHACTQCEQRFQKASALKTHMYDHTGAWPFKCAVCNVGFVREAELKEHVTIHTGEKPFKCQQCGAAFRLASTLKVHMRRHSGVKPYVCQLCGGRYAAANTLKEHLRTHAGERKFLCHTCGAAFVHQSGLVQHAKTHLAIEDRKHVCPYCQRRFNELALLKRHQRIHTNERPYMCSKCGKAFRRPGELSMHYRYHSNDRRYVCITCNKSFFTRSHLKRHQATHNSTFMSGAGHGSTLQSFPKSNPLTLHPPGQQSPRRYPHEGDYSPPEGLHVCMICSKQFRHIEQLTKHISRIHNPNMPMDEHMASVAAIEDYSHAYSAEELGLPYMNPMHMMPPMPQ